MAGMSMHKQNVASIHWESFREKTSSGGSTSWGATQYVWEAIGFTSLAWVNLKWAAVNKLYLPLNKIFFLTWSIILVDDVYPEALHSVFFVSFVSATHADKPLNWDI